MSSSVPAKDFEGLLDKPENQSMIEFLAQHQMSAHTDMVEMLAKSVESLPDVKLYCPDVDNHSYYIAHTPNGIMFAAAIGLSALMFRLPKQGMSGALVKGGVIIKEIGDSWVSFNPFWPEREEHEEQLREYRQMCKLAYHHALSLSK
jgi:hypothetical protein